MQQNTIMKILGTFYQSKGKKGFIWILHDQIWTWKALHVQCLDHNYCHIMLMSSMAPPVWRPDQNHIQCYSSPWILMTLSSSAGQAEPFITTSWFRTCNTSLWMRIAPTVIAACMNKMTTKDSCLHATPTSDNHCRSASTRSQPLDWQTQASHRQHVSLHTVPAVLENAYLCY